MTEKKITKKDNFVAIVNILEAAGHEDLAGVIKHEIELLEKKAAKAKATAAKKKEELDTLAIAVEAALTEDFAVIADIAERVEFDGEVSVGKVQYRLNTLVANNKAYKEQITVGEGTAKRKLMAYKKA